MKTKTRFIILTVSILILLFQINAFGAPACPDVIRIEQPDGSSFPGRIMGDEFQGWTETVDGYTVLKRSETGYWEYAVPDTQKGGIKLSGTVVVPNVAPPASLKKHTKPQRNTALEESQTTFLREMYQKRLADTSSLPATQGTKGTVRGAWDPVPVSGTKNLLVILVNFSNRSLSTTAAQWGDRVFATGAGVNSLRQYYRDISYGWLDINPVNHGQSGNPDGIVTVTINTPHPNYGNPSSSQYSVEAAWINLALTEAAKYIDFASWDDNPSDGVLTPDEMVVYLIPAGYEAAESSKTPNIWAHAWGGAGVYAGSTRVPKWAMNGELNNSSVQEPFGVFAHEMGHGMTGLPDLYNTNSADAPSNKGLGAFSLMASGNWGRDTGEYSGTTPVALDAWSREYVGWTYQLTPTTDGESVSIGVNLDASNYYDAVKLASSSSTEYFLAENRYPQSWDRGLIGLLSNSSWQGGLLVMHIDTTIGTPGSNNINRYGVGAHQGVMAEQANNAAYGSYGTSQTLYYGGNNSSFTSSTTPSSNFYDGSASGLGFTDLSGPGTTMTFTFRTGGSSGDIFTDVPSTHWAYNYITAIYNAGYTTGYGGTNEFKPDYYVTRAQMAAFISRAYDGTDPPSSYCTSYGVPYFSDIWASDWYCSHVGRLYSLGITTGYGGTSYYQPSYYVTRAQMAAFVVRALDGGDASSNYCTNYGAYYFSDIWSSDWYCSDVGRLYYLGITTGYGGTSYYQPNYYVTRAQMATFLARAFLGMN